MNQHFSDLWARGLSLSRALPEKRPAEEHETARPRAAATPGKTAAADESPEARRGRDDVNGEDSVLSPAQHLAGVGALTAGAAREMSYPLGVIASTCANLTHEMKGSPMDRVALVEAIERIERHALHCARIAEALGHYARAGQSDSDGLAVAITSPEAIVRDALLMVEQQFREVGRVTIQTEFPEKPLTIIGEHHLITQALVNLLLNARDAMQPAGGVIRLRFWTPDPAREPALAARLRSSALPARRADLVAFAVMDSGAGIHPSMMDCLFEPFSTTTPDGAGLGLPIARDIVARHGGFIWGENNPGGGATFTVVLPRKQ